MDVLLKINTLGTIGIYLNETPLHETLPTKAQALLVYLACHPEMSFPRPMLATLLWGDFPEGRALANLRVALHELREVVEDFLSISRQNIGLNPDSRYWVDYQEINLAYTATHHYLQQYQNLSPQLAFDLDAVIALAKGDFLADLYIPDSVEFEAWRSQTSQAVNAMMRRLILTVVEYHFSQPAYATAIQHTQRLIKIDPLDEKANYWLILLLARSGQRTDAMTHYQSYARLLQDELHTNPDADLQQLYESLVANQPMPVQPSRTPHNLPLQLNPHVGRHAERTRIQELLANPDCRLLTITGMGGMGKTHLGIQMAFEALGRFKDGVFFVPLAALQNVENVLPMLAERVSLQLEEGMATPLLEQITTYLKDQNILLVLDNFEHLLAFRDTVITLLASTTSLKILVTSQIPLGVRGEWLIPLEGLEYPPLPETQDWLEFGAVALFIQSAQRVVWDFNPNEHDTAIIRICQLVYGLPLGIEMAAGWVNVLAPQAIAAQVEQNLNFLVTSMGDLPTRHQSLQAVFTYAWNLLSPGEQELFSRLALFRDSFSFETVSKLASGTLNNFAKLVTHNLIIKQDISRYRLHDLLRHYAYEKLVESGQLETYSTLYFEYYRDFVHLIRAQSDVVSVYNLFELEYENIRSALTWALEHERKEELAQMCVDLSNFWTVRGRFKESIYWIAQTLALTGTLPRQREARLYVILADTHRVLGQYPLSETYFHKAAAIWRELGDEVELGRTLVHLGYIYLETEGDAASIFEEALALFRHAEDPDEIVGALFALGLLNSNQQNLEIAQQYLAECAEHFRKMNKSSHNLAVTLNMLGVTYAKQGAYMTARLHYEEARAIFEQMKDDLNYAITVANLGETAFYECNYAEARKWHLEGLTTFHRYGYTVGIVHQLESLADLALVEGRYPFAARLLGTAAHLREAIQAVRPERDLMDHEKRLRLVQENLTTQAFSHAWAEGKTMPIDQVIAEISIYF